MSSIFDKVTSFTKAYFKLDERDSTIEAEIRAGTTTFLTMGYILLVNPQLFSKIGIPSSDIVVSTAISAIIGSFITGIFGNLPFGLAPGVGLSTYLVYGLVLGEGLSFSQAFTSCFIAGVILLFLSVTGISHIIMDMIPHSVKIGTIVGMGLQIALVGFTSIDLVVESELTLSTLGNMGTYKIWLALFGLLLIGTLIHKKIKGGILIGIISIAISSWTIEKSFPTSFVQLPYLTKSVYDYINFEEFSFEKCGSAVIAFVFIGIIDVSGTLHNNIPINTCTCLINVYIYIYIYIYICIHI
jgi:AGZA family xanthine/uracil permease-like MFS transporter